MNNVIYQKPCVSVNIGGVPPVPTEKAVSRKLDKKTTPCYIRTFFNNLLQLEQMEVCRDVKHHKHTRVEETNQ